MKIYLIRHSESIDDIENCYGGIADFDLTKNGRNKVEQYRKETDCYGIEKIYTSPYKRAYQTAQILNENIKVDLEIVEDIRELNSHGIRSGVNKELAKDIFSYVIQKEEYKNTGYYQGKTFLGGEDIQEFDSRVNGAINSIIASSKKLKTIAIVTHGNVCKSIFKNILNINKKIELEDLATAILDYSNDKFRIIKTTGIEFFEDL